MSTWNKFCFTGGAIVTSIRLPGRSDVCALESSLDLRSGITAVGRN